MGGRGIFAGIGDDGAVSVRALVGFFVGAGLKVGVLVEEMGL